MIDEGPETRNFMLKISNLEKIAKASSWITWLYSCLYQESMTRTFSERNNQDLIFQITDKELSSRKL